MKGPFFVLAYYVSEPDKIWNNEMVALNTDFKSYET